MWFTEGLHFDRGFTWHVRADSVVGMRGVAPEKEVFSFTSSSVMPGKVGKDAYGFTIAYDCPNKYLVQNKGSIPSLLENIEFSTVQLHAIYMQDAMLAPRIGRIVVRGSKARCPYDTTSSPLGAVRAEWKANQVDATYEDYSLILPGYGGGVAWANTAGSDWAGSVTGTESEGTFDIVLRHELGHNWGPGDNPYNRTEDATLMSGNANGRFSGPEVDKVLDRRNSILSRLENLGPYTTTEVPPYAALDLVETPLGGGEIVLPVLDNDHDANGDALSLASFDSASVRGGRVRRSPTDPNVLLFAPAASADSLDRFRYVVQDDKGMRSSGVVLVRHLPGRTKFFQAESATAYHAPQAAAYTGFSGAGYVGFKGSDTSKVSWSIGQNMAGNGHLVFRYAKTGSDTAKAILLLDGKIVDTLRFRRSGDDLKAWDTVAIDLHLDQGSHQISLVAQGKANLDLDRLAISEDTAPDSVVPGLVAAGRLRIVRSPGVLRFEMDGCTSALRASLYGASGARIRASENQEISTTDLPRGIYLFTLQGGGALQTGSVLIGP